MKPAQKCGIERRRCEDETSSRKTHKRKCEMRFKFIFSRFFWVFHTYLHSEMKIRDLKWNAQVMIIIWKCGICRHLLFLFLLYTIRRRECVMMIIMGVSKLWNFCVRRRRWCWRWHNWRKEILRDVLRKFYKFVMFCFKSLKQKIGVFNIFRPGKSFSISLKTQ